MKFCKQTLVLFLKMEFKVHICSDWVEWEQNESTCLCFYDISEKLFCGKEINKIIVANLKLIKMETTCPTDAMPENGTICRVCREIGKLSLN